MIRKRAESEGGAHLVCTIGEYVRGITKNPMLADKLKGSGGGFDKGKDGSDKRFIFPEHLSPHSINVGVKNKSILQGRQS